MQKQLTMSSYSICLVLLVTCARAHIINRWAFQDCCDFVYDTTHDSLSAKDSIATFQPQEVASGATVFVRRNSLHDFFYTMHPKIKQPYILITHVDDPGVPGKFYTFLAQPKLIAWFGIHPTIAHHPKFFALPIGIYPQKNASNDHYCSQLREHTKKDRLLYMNFSVWTNRAEREFVRKLFFSAPFCVTQDKKLAWHDYMQEMAHFKFVLSPPGNGIDCYRTWEALAVGCIPIVKSSNLNALYKHLPVLIIDDWEMLTAEFLKQKYAAMSLKKYSFESMTMQYWIKKIEMVRAKSLHYKKSENDQR